MDCNKMKGAVTEEKIVAELRATATYLAAVSGTRIFEQNRNGFEKARTNRIRFLLNKLEINATSAANVVNAIRACASMSNEAKDSMIVMVHEKLVAPEGASSVPLKGGAQQDFRSIVNFMTAAAWESDEFEDEMIIVACSLGLVNPNEDTCAIMTAAAEAQEKGLKKAKEMKFVPLYEHLQNIKRKIKEHAAAMDQGGTLKHLPPTPDKLLLDSLLSQCLWTSTPLTVGQTRCLAGALMQAIRQRRKLRLLQPWVAFRRLPHMACTTT